MIAALHDRDSNYELIGLNWLAGVPAVGSKIHRTELVKHGTFLSVVATMWEVVNVTFLARDCNYHPSGEAEITVTVVRMTK